jgi:hypothetical protein
VAIITKPATIEKNSAATIVLNKSQLASEIADAYYADSANWKEVFIYYKSSTGNQRKILKFNASQTSPEATFLASLKARNIFQVQKIVVMDFDGGSILIPRADLTVADFDIDMSAPVVSAIITGDFTAGNPSWSYVSGPVFATAGYASITNGAQLGKQIGSSILQPSTPYKVRLYIHSVVGNPFLYVMIGGSTRLLTSELNASVGTYVEFTETTTNNIPGNWELLLTGASDTVNITKIEVFTV